MNTFSTLCLSLFKGLGKVTLRKIIDTKEFKDFDSFNSKDFVDFFAQIKEKYTFANKLSYSEIDIVKSIDRTNEIYEKSHKLNITIYSVLDQKYPVKLKNLVNSKGSNDSPIIIHCMGNIETLSLKHNSIAIIGTREPTEEGIIAGEYFTNFFANHKFNIVSGLAKGCDTLAHLHAIKNHSITTAVLAHGLDIVYPKENTSLLNDILSSNGIAISEYPIGTNSLPNYFIERDRIQAGLSDATLVIQTGIKGGTMHAVRTTLDNNKMLLAVSYLNSFNHEKILGNKLLISEKKARAITSHSKEIILQEILDINNSCNNSNKTLF